MRSIERRQNPRYGTDTRVTIRSGREKIPARMVDINEGGIGLVAERDFSPGTRLLITVRYIDSFLVDGTVKWAGPAARGQRQGYRIGIAAENITLKPKGNAAAAGGRSPFAEGRISGGE